MSEMDFYLIVLDGSNAMEQAIAYAKKTFKKNQASIALLQVLDDTEFSYWLGIGDRMRQAEIERNQELLDQTIDALKGEFKNIITIKRVGLLVNEIQDVLSADERIQGVIIAVNPENKDDPMMIVRNLLKNRGQTLCKPIIIVPYNEPET